MKNIIICLFVSFFILFGTSNNISAYNIQHYGPSAYLGGSPSELAIMEQNLGISGCVIEDFDDSNLIPGLTINGPPYGPSWGNTWGDPNTDASVMVYPKSNDPAVISISQGVNFIGIGIGWLEYQSLPGLYSILTINNNISVDITPTSFPNFDFGVISRNGYITISTEAGDPLISSISFHTSITTGDAYSFDYIAINSAPVPIPGAVWLLGSGFIGLVGFRKKYKAR